MASCQLSRSQVTGMNNYEIYPQRLGLKSFLLVLYLDQRPSALSNVGIPPGATDLRHRADAPGGPERGEAAPAIGGPAGLRGARCPAPLRAEPRDRLPAGAELGAVRRGVAQKMEFPKWPLVDGNKDSNLRLALAS